MGGSIGTCKPLCLGGNADAIPVPKMSLNPGADSEVVKVETGSAV